MKISKFWTKESEELLGSPAETMGYMTDANLLNGASIFQNFLIKKYDLTSIEQMGDVKKQLLGRKILIVNAKEILENRKIPIEDLKKAMDDLKTYLAESGGAIGRIGENYLIITPNAQIKLAN